MTTGEFMRTDLNRNLNKVYKYLLGKINILRHQVNDLEKLVKSEEITDYLYPEYPGAMFKAGGTTDSIAITTKSTLTYLNKYKILASGSTMNDYIIQTAWWKDKVARLSEVTISITTAETATTNNKVDIELKSSDQTASKTAQTSDTGGVVKDIVFTESDLADINTMITSNAMGIRLTAYSKESKEVNFGTIKIKYVVSK